MTQGILAASFVLLQAVFRRAGGLIYDFLLLSCGIRLLMFQPCLDRILICLIRSLIYYTVVVGMTRHEFWLDDIRDECIVGLDLLAHWGARVDVPGAALCLGNETVPLRSGRSRHGEATTPQLQPRHQCSLAPAPSRRTRAAETQGEPWRNIVAQTSTPQPLPPHTPTASPSPETVVAVEELGRRNGEYLSTPQQEQLRHILRLRHIFCGHFCSTRGGLYKDSSGAV